MRPAWAYLEKKINQQVPGTVDIIVEIVIATFIVIIFAEFIPRAIFGREVMCCLTKWH
jgi:hypothetical protein